MPFLVPVLFFFFLCYGHFCVTKYFVADRVTGNGDVEDRTLGSVCGDAGYGFMEGGVEWAPVMFIGSIPFLERMERNSLWICSSPS